MTARNPQTLQFQQRTRTFALRVIRLVESLPKKMTAEVIGRQVLRSATSVAANCRARSTAEFRSKLGVVEEELDESLFWIELLVDSGLIPSTRLSDLIREGNELLAMVVASIRTSRRKSQK